MPKTVINSSALNGLQGVLEINPLSGANPIKMNEMLTVGSEDSYIQLASTPGVPTGTTIPNGSLVFDRTNEAIYLKESTGWAKLVDTINDGETLNDVLTNGNTSGANNIIMSTTQKINYVDVIKIDSDSATAGIQIGDGASASGTACMAIGHGTSIGGISTIAIGKDISAPGMTADAFNNIMIGSNVGAALTTGDNNLLLSTRAGDAITTGIENIVLGRDAGGSIIAADSNICIGPDSDTGGSSTIVIGDATQAGSGANGITIGTGSGNALNTGADNIIIGQGSGLALVDAISNVIIGDGAGNVNTTGDNAISIGTSADASSDLAIAIGKDATANAFQGIAIGQSSSAAASSTAVGPGAIATTLATSLGISADALGSSSVAVGNAAQTGTGANGITIGKGSGNASATGASNVIIGDTAGTTDLGVGANNVIIGSSADGALNKSNAIVIGSSASSGSNSGIAIGNLSSVGSSLASPVAIGPSASVTADNGTAVGGSASAASSGSAFGVSSTATTNGTGIGYQADASGSGGTAVGYQAVASGTSSVALGTGSEASGTGSIAIGCINAVDNTVKFEPSEHVLIDSSLRMTGNFIQTQVKTTKTTTLDIALTAAEILTELVSIGGQTTTLNITMPSYTAIDGALTGGFGANESFSIIIENRDTVDNLTLVPGTSGSFKPQGGNYTLAANTVKKIHFWSTGSAYEMRVL